MFWVFKGEPEWRLLFQFKGKKKIPSKYIEGGRKRKKIQEETVLPELLVLLLLLRIRPRKQLPNRCWWGKPRV